MYLEGLCNIITEHSEGVGYKLVPRHINKAATEAVMRQHQERLHQVTVDTVQVLDN